MARRCSTICLPIDQDAYPGTVAGPARFRAWLDRADAEHPELFPSQFGKGYRLKDHRDSARAGVRLRRIEPKATGESFSVRPSFLLPYLTGTADQARGPLFLRAFGVPYWALARVFGKPAMYWYRLEVGLGRCSVAGTTVRRAEVPAHLLADEHHQTHSGAKCYLAATVGGGCCLGAELAPTASAPDLTAAYAVFRREAQGARPGYAPKTVSADGWAATHQAWAAPFPLAVVVRCFLHGWLAVRARGKLSEYFGELSARVWRAYRAPDRRSFAQRLRRLGEWARGRGLSAWLLGRVEKLCGRAAEYGAAYDHPGCHRTSNMLDRVMRPMSRYFDAGLHLHGSPGAAGLRVRAWAPLHNFRPWHPAAARANGGWRCPAERLNRHRYHDDWLQNLLVSASLGGYRR